MKLLFVIVPCLTALVFAPQTDGGDPQGYEVIATAYNSVPEQTDDTPNIAAWGDRLEPGMKALAVSRDLIPLGLTRHTRVSIEGIEGEFLVLDKMNKRWKNRIDIYMGKNINAARQWGVKKVRIQWQLAQAQP